MQSVLKITILLGSSAAATLALAGGQTGVNNQGDGGVQAAIQFENAKAAADARQAGMEAARSHQATPAQGAAAAKSSAAGTGEQGVGAAIRFEQNKAAADARQARIAAGQAGSADRRVTGHK